MAKRHTLGPKRIGPGESHGAGDGEKENDGYKGAHDSEEPSLHHLVDPSDSGDHIKINRSSRFT